MICSAVVAHQTQEGAWDGVPNSEPRLAPPRAPPASCRPPVPRAAKNTHGQASCVRRIPSLHLSSLRHDADTPWRWQRRHARAHTHGGVTCVTTATSGAKPSTCVNGAAPCVLSGGRVACAESIAARAAMNIFQQPDSDWALPGAHVAGFLAQEGGRNERRHEDVLHAVGLQPCVHD